LANIYLVSFASTAAPESVDTAWSPLNGTADFIPFRIRVGYFSLCVETETDHWTCGDSAEKHFSRLIDPWNLYKTASDLRTGVFSPSLKYVSPQQRLS